MTIIFFEHLGQIILFLLAQQAPDAAHLKTLLENGPESLQAPEALFLDALIDAFLLLGIVAWELLVHVVGQLFSVNDGWPVSTQRLAPLPNMEKKRERF
jgi:hypothetical protein